MTTPEAEHVQPNAELSDSLRSIRSVNEDRAPNAEADGEETTITPPAEVDLADKTDQDGAPVENPSG